MFSSLLLVVSLWAQPGCPSAGYPLDGDFSSAHSLRNYLQPLDTQPESSPSEAAAAPCRPRLKAMANSDSWWQFRLLSGGSNSDSLVLRIPARAAPSLCVHWPQRGSFVADCVDSRTVVVEARRFHSFAVPESMQWGAPVLLQLRDGLYAPVDLNLISDTAARRQEHETILGTGLLVGLLSMVAIVCVLAFIVVRRFGYLYAAVFIFMTCLAWVGFSGRGIMLPGAFGLWLSRSGAMVATQLAWLGVFAYTRSYLSLREKTPDWIVLGSTGLVCAHCVVLLLALTKPSVAITAVVWLAVPTVLALLGVMVWQIRLGSERARYLLAALILLVLGMTVSVAGWVLVAPAALRFGSVLTVVGLLVCPAVLLLGIYRRYDQLEKQRNNAQQTLASEQRLALLRASYCRVTGLPRRPKLAELVGRLLENADSKQVEIGVYLLNVDNLRQIRQQYGRDTLEEVVSVLGTRLRDSLDDNQLLGRLENWELVVVVPAPAGGRFRECLYQAARDISSGVRTPIATAEHTVTLSVSVGMAIWPSHADDFETLLRCCDSALYEAQRSGGNAFKAYSEKQHSHRADQFRRINDLKRALDQEELELFYQPVHDSVTGAVTSMEALIRWHHPEFGLLAPNAFVPLAEETDMILDLGNWTLRAAAADLKLMIADNVSLPIAINVSPRQFAARGFVGHIREILRQNTFAAELLRLEITEHSLIDDWERTAFALTELRNLGVGVYVDDFGVGYSSLNYVRTLPIRGLKIDLSFVKNLGKSPQDEAVVSTIVQLARSLNLQVIAEGVETDYQREFLSAEGCHHLQGHFFSKPLPRAELLEYVHRYESDQDPHSFTVVRS